MPVDLDPSDSIGARVRAARKLAGLTQAQLSSRTSFSVSLIKQVEQGRVPASAAFVSAVARALHVQQTHLLHQPYGVDSREGHRVHAVIPGLRREIAAFRLPPESDGPRRSLDDLAAAVANVSKLRHSATLDSLGAELPGLLQELREATYFTKGRERELLFGLLAEAYAAAGQVAYKLGYADLSSLTTDRVEWAARKSGDPLAVAAADFYVAGELIVNAEWRGALSYLDRARDRIADDLRKGGEPSIAMHGVLHLKSGLAAARSGDAEQADAHLAEARDAARRVTPGSDHYRLAFDRDSVAIWSVGLAVERLDGTEAVKRADGLRFSRTTPKERIGHHWIDLSRAYQLHGDRTRALKTLYRARKTSPQQTRYHPQVRETLVTLAEHDKRRSDSLSGLARWAGVRI